ncbi:MAG: DUF2779 domain-containing protein [Planctomycetota bacterium]|nr:DUF2779 domain-containing protein [Planctomycetota bacterium]
MPRRLSKTRVQTGLQCHRYLWWKTYEPDAAELVPDAALQAVFDRGNDVGEAAQAFVPGGVLIDRDKRGIRGALEDTQAALARGESVLYEAAFVADDVFVAVDILERNADGWNLIEVKSTTSVKEPHLSDVAIQMHVLRAAGVDVVRGEVMVLNRACVFPDLSNLFTRHDVTEEAASYLPDVLGAVRAQQAMLEADLPVVEVGEHCHKPYACPFHDRCWPELPEHHVSTLYYGRGKAQAWEEAGYATLLDLPEDEPLSAVQQRQIRAVRQGALVCDEGLGEALATLPDAVGYLDFETIMLAIPRWDGCRPYDQVPAQFVCYVRDADGVPQLREWLAEGGGDPRPELARRLVEACRGAAVLLAWHASFEQTCIRGLADAVPELADELLDISRRIVDLLPIVRNHVYHPAFGGGFSLKVVLPALVPELSYEDLEIQGGVEASRVLEGLVVGSEDVPAEECARLRAALTAYCRLDTWGMVKLHERLVALAVT